MAPSIMDHCMVGLVEWQLPGSTQECELDRVVAVFRGGGHAPLTYKQGQEQLTYD